jgi:hypothetical protein
MTTQILAAQPIHLRDNRSRQDLVAVPEETADGADRHPLATHLNNRLGLANVPSFIGIDRLDEGVAEIAGRVAAAGLRGWHIMPSHYIGQDLAEVWPAE